MSDSGYLKDNLKKWIKTTPGMNRSKLADLCGITKRTLDNWLTEKGVIPHAKRTLLELMLSEKNKKSSHSFFKATLGFDFEEFQQMQKIAEQQQVSVRKWLETNIKQLIRPTDKN